MTAESSHVALLHLSTPDDTESVARRVFAALSITEFQRSESSKYVEGGYFQGRVGAIRVNVSRGEPADFLHAEYPIAVWVDAGRSAAASSGELAAMVAFEMLRATFGVVEMLPSLVDGVGRWREFVIDRRDQLQSLVLERPLNAP